MSGGHTALIRVDAPGATRLLGATRDDAAGEAFDKVGKLLGLGYPGGVAIDKLAATGDPRAVALPRALAGRDDLDFSFSGLKTAVATLLARRALPEGPGAGRSLRELPGRRRRRAGAQVAARARAARGCRALVVCGGVAANRGLRAALAAAAREDGFALLHPAAEVLHRQRRDDRGRGDAALRSAASAPGSTSRSIRDCRSR